MVTTGIGSYDAVHSLSLTRHHSCFVLEMAEDSPAQLEWMNDPEILNR